jgi:hypothetical protein
MEVILKAARNHPREVENDFRNGAELFHGEAE